MRLSLPLSLTISLTTSRLYSAFYIHPAHAKSPSLSFRRFIQAPFTMKQPHDDDTTTTTLQASTTTTEATSTSSPSSPPSPLLQSLYDKMDDLGLDAYIIPSDDPHLSEYVSDAFQRRAFVTGFTGSAGTAVVTREEGGYLWTDSRYFNQASLELDASQWTLMKQGEKDVPTIPKFLSKQALTKYKTAEKPFVIGIDPYLHPTSFAKEVTEALTQSSSELSSSSSPPVIGSIKTISPNVIDPLWTDRPPLPSSRFRIHPLEYAGKTASEKITAVTEEMKKKGATLCILSALDDVAYCLNVRGKDVDCNPVGISYVTIERKVGEGDDDDVTTTTLYCDEDKVANVKEYLEENGVTIAPYESLVPFVTDYCSTTESESDSTTTPQRKVWIHTPKTNYAIGDIIPPTQLLDEPNPIVDMKSLKNDAELQGMRRAHEMDGVAMARFVSRMRRHAQQQSSETTWTEVTIDEELRRERSRMEGYFEDSFPTIAGVGSNGAIVHYRAESSSPLTKVYDGSEPILIDSGGQYDYGTTDVTRTWHFGTTPDKTYREMYTRVLQGNIALDSCVFPENTPGFVLDVLARKSLWSIGCDYGHGTGHGVGAAMNVHEGPQSISPRYANMAGLKKGMVVSNEPGYYKDGAYGIRIENLLEIREVEREDKEEGAKTFLKFEKLTLIPIQSDLILVELMTESELDWLDSYHEMVYERVGKHLEEGSLEKEWLKEACAKIDRKRTD